MKKLAPILLLVCVASVCVVTNAAENTNATTDGEKSIRAGAIVVTQNGFPPSLTTEHPSNSLAGEWVIPILKLIIWPTLIGSVVAYFRNEIRAKLKQVTTVKGGEHVAVEFSPDVREQQKASAPNPSAPGITGNNEEFEKLKAQAATSLIVKDLANEILGNLGKTNLTDPQKLELGALTVAALRIDVFFLEGIHANFWNADYFTSRTQLAEFVGTGDSNLLQWCKSEVSGSLLVMDTSNIHRIPQKLCSDSN